MEAHVDVEPAVRWPNLASDAPDSERPDQVKTLPRVIGLYYSRNVATVYILFSQGKILTRDVCPDAVGIIDQRPMRAAR